MQQSVALDILKAGRNVYLTGAAGSGKTHVLNSYIDYLKDRKVSVGVTASTGIAATHLGGMTIHSWSGMGIRDTLSERDIDELLQKEYLFKRFDKTNVLIIDEVSMLSPYFFNSLDELVRKMKQTDLPFGGMQMVLSGDFFQLPPIVKGEQDIHFVTASEAWSELDIRVCYLEEQYRQEEDEVLLAILQEIRAGTLSDMSRQTLLDQNNKSFDDGIMPTRLFTHNKDVDALNLVELEKLRGNKKAFTMTARGKSSLVAALKKAVLAPELLELKEEAVVMFVKNNFEAGYVNGTLGVVEGFDGDTPVVKTFSGDVLYVSPMQWAVEEDGAVIAEVTQLPLRLAWAITVHKSQGMTLDAADMDLSKSFVPGQGYVALSRVRSLKGLLLRGANDTAFSVHDHVLELDQRLRAQSEKWEKVVGRFGEPAMKKMHIDFVEACGGTNDLKEIAKNKKREKIAPRERVPTHEKTKSLIDQGLTLEEIAKERGVKKQTIVSHLQKLKELDPDIDLDRFKPKTSDFRNMKAAFESTGDIKLTPVHKKLKGKYSYVDLSLARLFL